MTRGTDRAPPDLHRSEATRAHPARIARLIPRAAAFFSLALATSHLGACGKKESRPPLAAGSGSAVSAVATNDPGRPAAAPPDAAEAPCVDDDIKKHIADSLAVSLAYLASLENKIAKWGRDCEQAKNDLLALEPEATRFMHAMTDFASWGRALSPSCQARLHAIGEQMPEARDIEKPRPLLDAKLKSILETCGTHPGFKEAAAKGLRLMRRKDAP